MTSGVLETECADRLKRFFASLRASGRSDLPAALCPSRCSSAPRASKAARARLVPRGRNARPPADRSRRIRGGPSRSCAGRTPRHRAGSCRRKGLGSVASLNGSWQRIALRRFQRSSDRLHASMARRIRRPGFGARARGSGMRACRRSPHQAPVTMSSSNIGSASIACEAWGLAKIWASSMAA